MRRVFNVMVVYEDAAACEWAREHCAEMVMGPDAKDVRSTWWKLNDLSHPAVLAGAVSKAMRADVVVVAVRETEGFPLPFYVWVNSWLPHRLRGTGTLLGLLASSERPNPHMNRAAKFLRAVARRVRMNCLLRERKLVGVAPCVVEEVL
jgi:hypothetical protein